MQTNMDEDWHEKEETQDTVYDFHEQYAFFPAAQVNKAKGHFDNLMNRIKDHFEKAGVATRFLRTGSIAEGTKVASSDLEFDVMVILKGGGNKIVAKNTRPCYYKLRSCVWEGSDAFRHHQKIRDKSSEYLLTDKTIFYFHSLLHQFRNEDDSLKKSIGLRYHGPAVQMDVYRPIVNKKGTDGQDMRRLFYSVDMVPSFYSEGNYYVAKPFPDEHVDREEWRLSFSLQERSILDKLDPDGKCQKMCIQVLKVLRDKHVHFNHLNSYIIKTGTLSLCRDYPNLNWSQDRLGSRLIDVLKYLNLALQGKNLPNLFVKEHNLFHSIRDDHRQNMKYYLRNVITSETQFNRALESSVYTIRFEGLLIRKQSQVSSPSPRNGEVVTVSYILRQGENLQAKLRSEGILLEENEGEFLEDEGESWPELLRYIVTVLLFLYCFCFMIGKMSEKS